MPQTFIFLDYRLVLANRSPHATRVVSEKEGKERTDPTLGKLPVEAIACSERTLIPPHLASSE